MLAPAPLLRHGPLAAPLPGPVLLPERDRDTLPRHEDGTMNTPHPSYQWLTTGDDYYAALLEAIARAGISIRLEMYIYTDGYPGDAIRDALSQAARRGVRVQILLDAFGSYELPAHYWDEAKSRGAEVRFFNPLTLKRLAFRDHRKLLVCDEHTAFLSGFNITHLETGDGIRQGWRDLGLKLSGSVAHDLAVTFDRMFTLADVRHRRLALIPHSLRRRVHPRHPGQNGLTVLTSGPGQNGGAFKRALLQDLRHAGNIRVISAYFLPTYRIRRLLARAARGGRDIKLITAGKTDVRMARYAGRALYQRLLRAGIRIFEYEAQVLHSKLIIADDVVYVGSANLDTRSLNINYELLVRIKDRQLAHEARLIFNDHLTHCREIRRQTWRRSRGLWEKFTERASHFILARLDFTFARRQLVKLR